MDGITLSPLVLSPPPNIIRVVDSAGLQKLSDFFSRCGKLMGWDIETTPLRDFFWRKVRTIQFGNAQEQYVIDLKAFCGSADELYQAQGYYGRNVPACLREVLDVIRPVLTDPTFIKVGVNLGFEYMTMYWNFGMRTCGFFDCSMVERAIYAGLHSLKDYDFYSMEEMFARYFQKSIDKSLQESFNLDDDLSDAQYEYAALDTRTPLALRAVQNFIIVGMTVQGAASRGLDKIAACLSRVPSQVLGDDLTKSVNIENEAIGSFQDMHIHGERTDRPRWTARTERKIAELQALLRKLDEVFLPLVGSKNENITDEEIARLEAEWKSYNTPSDLEISLRSQLRTAKRNDLTAVPSLEQQISRLEQQRKAIKEEKKHICGEKKKQRTAIRNLAAECEGEALINYSSDAQLMKVLKANFKPLAHLSNMDDETLEKYEKTVPVMGLIRTYHGLSKEINTYGMAWATEWRTHPCNEEGWLHPGDGRLHSKFNQFEAVTGRSSSDQPNGQNLPQDKDVRHSFIADPPDESIRISNCCNVEAAWNAEGDCYYCSKCNDICATHAEEYVLVTSDMSGAELRIIAEAADDPIWIAAFARDEDVHSVGTEIMYPDIWPGLTVKSLAKPNGWTLQDSEDEVVLIIPPKEPGGKEAKIGPCAYYAIKDNGEPARKKCGCPKHNSLRNDNKSTNFLLAYGGGATTLAARIKKSVLEAAKLMGLHEQKFPKIWAYLKKSGNDARMFLKSFDLFGGRRIYPEPTRERAIERLKQYEKKKLELPKEQQTAALAQFEATNGRKPTDDERYVLTHRDPTDNEITKSQIAMFSSIERAGKNQPIQGTNARIAKKAMGSGFDKNGVPFLWHTLPQYRAKLVKFVHDELVIQCPKQYGEQIAALVGDAFKRAAAEVMSKVVMDFEYKVSTVWEK